MPSITAANGNSIILGDETRRLRFDPPSQGVALDLAQTEVRELWIDHARGSDSLGLVTTDLAPRIPAAFERAIREAGEGEEITLLLVCKLAAEAAR